MDWLKIKETDYYKNIVLKDKNDSECGKLEDMEFDIVIGSDLMW